MITKDYPITMMYLCNKVKKSSNQENQEKSWFRHLLKIKINE